MEHAISIISLIISGITSIGLVIIAFRKLPKENRLTDAETDAAQASAIKSILEGSNSLIVPLQTRIEMLEGELGQLVAQNTNLMAERATINEKLERLENTVDLLRAENKVYRNWATRLVRQLKENNIVPVPMNGGE